MTIGENLKRARKKLNLNLDEVAEKTKIAKMFLIALENDDISSLPQGVYTRNFLRTYAKFLQLDEDIITAEYHEQYHVKPHFVVHQEQTKHDDLQFRRMRRKFLVFFSLTVVVLVGVVYFLLPRYRDSLMELFRSAIDGLRQESTQAEIQRPVKPPEGVGNLEASSNEDLPPSTVDGGSIITENEGESSDANHAEPPVDPNPASGSPDSTVSGGEDALAHDDDGTEAEEASPPPTAAEQGSEENTDVALPVTDLRGLYWTPSDRAAANLDEMFAVQATGEVWLEVIIDGVPLTQRILQEGQTRFYKYGEKNKVIIGDASKIAVQDGNAFQAQVSNRSLILTLVNFGPGELLPVLNAQIKAQERDEN